MHDWWIPNVKVAVISAEDLNKPKTGENLNSQDSSLKAKLEPAESDV